MVLLATPQVLETLDIGSSSVAAEFPADPARRGVTGGRVTVADDVMAPVMEILNEGPARVLWQCGALDPEERGLSTRSRRRPGSPSPIR